jgi:hypothetical protein
VLTQLCNLSFSTTSPEEITLLSLFNSRQKREKMQVSDWNERVPMFQCSNVPFINAVLYREALL